MIKWEISAVVNAFSLLLYGVIFVALGAGAAIGAVIGLSVSYFTE